MSKYLRGDASLKVTKALPNGAAAVTSDFIDLGHTVNGDHLAEVELLIEAPVQATGILGDAATMKFDVLSSASADGSSPTTIAKEVLVQTGAGGAGAAANSARFRFPSNVARYVGVKCTKSAAGDSSASVMTVSLKS